MDRRSREIGHEAEEDPAVRVIERRCFNAGFSGEVD